MYDRTAKIDAAVRSQSFRFVAVKKVMRREGIADLATFRALPEATKTDLYRAYAETIY